MKKILMTMFTLAFGLLPALLTGCASIVGGTSQNIQVSTIPESGAQCFLRNDKGKYYLPCTPGTVVVHRSYGDLFITAQKPGYQTSTVRIQSRTKGLAFGNALFGGPIGAGVDCADGAAYDYPCSVVVPMKRIK